MYALHVRDWPSKTSPFIERPIKNLAAAAFPPDQPPICDFSLTVYVYSQLSAASPRPEATSASTDPVTNKTETILQIPDSYAKNRAKIFGWYERPMIVQGQVWGLTTEQCVAVSTLRRYSYVNGLAVTSRTPGPSCPHPQIGLHLTQP